MFFMSNSVWETLQNASLDASYGKGDNYYLYVIVHPNVYHELLKAAEKFSGTLLTQVKFDGPTPVWDMGRYSLKFIKSFDITEKIIFMVEDIYFHTITIQNATDKNTLPGS